MTDADGGAMPSGVGLRMAMLIRELRPEDRPGLSALAGGDAGVCDAAFAGSDRHLSMVALDGGNLVAAMLLEDRGGRSYRLIVAESHRGGDLTKQLVDTALHKLRQLRAHRCRFRLGDAAGATFWDEKKWGVPVGPTETAV
jgi:predicted N-acetyltransferase YhbS